MAPAPLFASGNLPLRCAVHAPLAPPSLIRDPRWGRTNEMIGGEDPYLGSILGVAFVRGIQAGSAPTGAPATAYRMVCDRPPIGAHPGGAQVVS